MSERWPGGLISKTPVTPTGPNYNGTAPGIWTIDQMNYWKSRGLWPDPAIVSDPYWSYVSYLLSTTATNAQQNNTFLDSSTNNFTITRNGNTTQGSATPYGTLWSNYFDGAGDYLTSATATAQGSGDYTIEGWFNTPTIGGTRIIYDCRPSGTNGAYPVIYVDGSGYLSLYLNSADRIKSSNVTTTNVWHHFALCRSGTSTKLFLDGVQQGSTYTDTVTYLMGASRPVIGTDGSSVNVNNWLGYISNIRAVNGTALYTSNFTPPTTPLTAISGTTFLTCQSNRFKDNSTNNFAITAVGDTKVTAFSPFILAYPGYTTAANGGSAYFDGSDYLTAPANAAYAFGTGDFTVECWVNFNAGSAGGRITTRQSGGGANGTWGFNFGPTTFAFTEVIAGEPGVTASGLPNMVNAWTHLVACRSGTTLRLFANGVLVGSGTNTTNFNNSTYQLGIGAAYETAITGYISNLRIVKGTAIYTAAFTPPTTPPTAVSGTSILCNFTNSGLFDAAMQNDMETAGSAQVSTTQAKYGTTSVAFNGSTDWLSTPNKPSHNFGTGDFTIEAWVYSTGSNAQATIVSNYNGPSDGFGLLQGSTGPLFGWGDTNLLAGSSAITQNAWYHIAVTRSGTALRMFLNGTQIASATNSTNFTTTGALYVGRLREATAGFYWQGYIDDLRITDGYARYTANFTPPAAALPVY